MILPVGYSSFQCNRACFLFFFFLFSSKSTPMTSVGSTAGLSQQVISWIQNDVGCPYSHSVTAKDLQMYKIDLHSGPPHRGLPPSFPFFSDLPFSVFCAIPSTCQHEMVTVWRFLVTHTKSERFVDSILNDFPNHHHHLLTLSLSLPPPSLLPPPSIGVFHSQVAAVKKLLQM